MNPIPFYLLMLLSLASVGSAELQSNRQAGRLGEITQLRPQFEIPDGFKVVSQRWIPVQVTGKCHGVAFDGGQVFAVTSATVGSRMRVMWDLVLVNWDKQQFEQISREYIIEFDGKPEGPPANPPPDSPTKVTRVTFVHERRDQIVPRPIQAALQKLNSQGIPASAVDKDARDGTGQVPDQYKVALAKANAHGLPCLVVQRSDGSAVAMLVRTEADVMEAIK